MNNYIIYDDMGKGRHSVVQKVGTCSIGQKEAIHGIRRSEKLRESS